MRIMTLEERRITLLKIMDYVDKFCKENHLCYFLICGSLLGAIRHKGFIPWDDDMDIAMPRKDYEIFSKSFNRCSSTEFEFVNEDNLKGYYLPFGKVLDKKTLLIENVRNPVELGVNIDVFPVDLLGNDLEAAKHLKKNVERLQKILGYTTIKFGKKDNLYKTIFLNVFVFFMRLLPRKLLIKKINCLARKFDCEKDSKYVASIVMATYGKKEIMDSRLFDKVIHVSFEGRLYCAPIGYHDILTHLYKDYMQLPPAEKRVTHHSNTASWRD